MRRHDILLSLSAAVVSFLLLHFVLSSGDESDFSQLQSYRDTLEGNVAALEELNEELTAVAALYERDVRAIAVEARNLSYYRSGERVIRIPSREEPLRSMSPGGVLRRELPDHDERVVSMLGAAIVFLLVLFTLILLNEQSKDRQSTRRASR